VEALGTVLFLSALFGPVIALITAAGLYPRYATIYGADTRSSKPLGRFIGGILLYGVGLGFVGLVLGIPVFCSIWANAQCGLGGIFIAPPLGFTGGVALFLYTSLRRAPAA
jgi:hypothetical protein